ncbi:MAG: YlxR family protein [Deltaproteobacteria bacterium]
MRTCIGCRKTIEKKYFVRLVACNGALKADGKAVIEGRGAYICPEKVCLDGAYKKGAFTRALKAKADIPDIDALWREIEGAREAGAPEAGRFIKGPL